MLETRRWLKMYMKRKRVTNRCQKLVDGEKPTSIQEEEKIGRAKRT